MSELEKVEQENKALKLELENVKLKEHIRITRMEVGLYAYELRCALNLLQKMDMLPGGAPLTLDNAHKQVQKIFECIDRK